MRQNQPHRHLDRYFSYDSALPPLNNREQFLCKVQVLEIKAGFNQEGCETEGTNDEKSLLLGTEEGRSHNYT